MTGEEFVRQVTRVVYEDAIDASASLLQKPPGRSPRPSVVALSQWFNGLSDADKRNIRAVLRLAARQAVFGMLAVLDGVRAIDESPDKGRLELQYTKAGCTTVINDPDEESLHDLFQQKTSSQG